jgi:riboflavin kinase
VRGTVFSDLGLARGFMSLEWARRAMQDKIGFDPYPGTLNLRLERDEALRRWKVVQGKVTPVVVPSPDPSFCSSHYFMGSLTGWKGSNGLREPVAVVVPEVKDYPEDKIEVIAARALKVIYPIRDGDELTLVFECGV